MNKKWLESIYDKIIFENNDSYLNTYTNGFYKKTQNKGDISNNRHNNSNLQNKNYMLSSKQPIPRQTRIQKTKKMTNYTKKDSKQKFFDDVWDKLINYNLDEIPKTKNTLEIEKNSKSKKKHLKSKAKNVHTKKSSVSLKRNKTINDGNKILDDIYLDKNISKIKISVEKNVKRNFDKIKDFKEMQENQETNYTYLNETTNRKNTNSKSKNKGNDDNNNSNSIKFTNNKYNEAISNAFKKTNKYKILYQECEQEKNKLKIENEELNEKLRKTLDELDIMKEEKQLNQEKKIENEKKIEEFLNNVQKNMNNSEQKIYSLKELLFKKDEEIKKLNKEIDVIDNKKKNIIKELEYKLSCKDKEIANYINIIKQMKENKNNDNVV